MILARGSVSGFREVIATFSVETTGALRPEEVVFAAIHTLQSKLQFLQSRYDYLDLDATEEGKNEPATFVDTGGFI